MEELLNNLFIIRSQFNENRKSLSLAILLPKLCSKLLLMLPKEFTAFLLLILVMGSCTSETASVNTKPDDNKPADTAVARALDTNLLVNTIDNKRLEIETQIDQIDRISLPTDSLRAKISQKWAQIHYYLLEGKVVRIKTYPHVGISKRTEEFYFNDGELIMVTVEDQGLGKPGKEKGLMDKVYYFHEGRFLSEYSATKERETNIKRSESDELMQEASEYLYILRRSRQ